MASKFILSEATCSADEDAASKAKQGRVLKAVEAAMAVRVIVLAEVGERESGSDSEWDFVGGRWEFDEEMSWVT